jgi:hypothetical protein
MMTAEYPLGSLMIDLHLEPLSQLFGNYVQQSPSEKVKVV